MLTGEHIKKAMLKANPTIEKVLVARVQSMTPEQRQVLKTLITPESADAVKVLLPELGHVIDNGVSNGG